MPLATTPGTGAVVASEALQMSAAGVPCGHPGRESRSCDAKPAQAWLMFLRGEGLPPSGESAAPLQPSPLRNAFGQRTHTLQTTRTHDDTYNQYYRTNTHTRDTTHTRNSTNRGGPTLNCVTSSWCGQPLWLKSASRRETLHRHLLLPSLLSRLTTASTRSCIFENYVHILFWHQATGEPERHLCTNARHCFEIRQ